MGFFSRVCVCAVRSLIQSTDDQLSTSGRPEESDPPPTASACYTTEATMMSCVVTLPNSIKVPVHLSGFTRIGRMQMSLFSLYMCGACVGGGIYAN